MVVAIVIVGTGVVAVSATVTALSGGAAFSADSTAAAALAQDLMAEIDTRPFHADTPTPTGRIIDGLVAYYAFEDAAGQQAADGSRLSPPAHLDFIDPDKLSWTPGANGISITSGGALKNVSESYKVVERCVASGQVSVEIWFKRRVAEGAKAGGEAALVHYMGTEGVNFVLAEREGNLAFYVRRDSTDAMGAPAVATINAPVGEDAVHVAATFDGSRSWLYLNGMPAACNDAAAGALGPWENHPLGIGMHPDWGVAWEGTVFLAAIYARALTLDEVQKNFAAGPSPAHLHNRTGYDDIDDYNGYADFPPCHETGSAIDGAEGYSRAVQVVNVAEGNLGTEKSWDSTDAKRVTVSVYRNYQLMGTLIRARYRGVSPDDAN